MLKGKIIKINQNKFTILVDGEEKIYTIKQTKAAKIRFEELEEKKYVNFEKHINGKYTITSFLKSDERKREMKSSLKNDSSIMIVMSTGNQTVNLIPIIQMKFKKVIILSTSFAEKNLTKNMEKVLNERGITPEIIRIEKDIENNIYKIKKKLEEIIKSYLNKKIIFNITGGQKNYSMAAYSIMESNTILDIQLLYIDANTKKIILTNNNNESNEEKINSNLELEEILNLYNFRTNNKKKEINLNEMSNEVKNAGKVLKYYYENDLFREIFIRSSDRKDIFNNNGLDKIIKKAITSITPILQEVEIKSERYRELQNDIKYIVKNYKQKKIDTDRLIRIENKEKLFNEYWIEMKKIIIKKVKEEMQKENKDWNDFRIYDNLLTKEKKIELTNIFKDINGELRLEKHQNCIKKKDIEFSKLKNIGFLFEDMVTFELQKIINDNPNLKSKIYKMYSSVETIRNDIDSNENEAEYDIIIVTKYGTLLILEIKAGHYIGDTAKSKAYGAIKKSGPYGRTAIIGPIIDKLTKSNNELLDFVPGAIKSHKIIAENTGINYIQIDKLKEYLEKNL